MLTMQGLTCEILYFILNVVRSRLTREAAGREGLSTESGLEGSKRRSEAIH